MVVKPLSELKPGQKGVINKVGGSGRTHRRILDMELFLKQGLRWSA